MRSVFTVRAFHRWAKRAEISDLALFRAIKELDAGLIDARLAAHLFKKRIPASSRGKRGGARTIVAYMTARHAFFIYGYLKNEKENLDGVELFALKQFAAHLMRLSDAELERLINRHEIFEVRG